MNTETELFQRITGKPEGLRIVTFASYRFSLPEAAKVFLRHELARLIACEKGPALFLTDLAGDFQKTAAEEVLKLRNVNTRIELGVFPLLRLWDAGPLAARADYASTFAEQRNTRMQTEYRCFLAEHTDRFLCCFTADQIRHSELIRLAAEKGRDVYNLYPAYSAWKDGSGQPHAEREV